MDRILFGDNQFFGINHMSEGKACAQAMRFRDSKSIMAVLDDAYDMGIKTFMCTTHDMIRDICSFVREHPRRYDGFKFYPGMPYAHKYANAVTEEGILGALRRFSSGGVMGTVIKGGSALVTQDVIGMMKLLIDSEMKMFEGLSTEVIFLQNVIVDLLLGLGMKTLFIEYSKYIKERYRSEPGFITMNLPRLLDTLEECGIVDPIICASINKAGFRMSGGIEPYEKALDNGRFRPIAMSVFASGAISPEEAIRYVCGFRKIESIVFGASSKTHISQTRELISKYSL